MKKFLTMLFVFILACSVFAKTQKVVKYSVCDRYCQTIDPTPEINSMISQGWQVVSITPITTKVGYSNPTDYIIVVFEKE